MLKIGQLVRIDLWEIKGQEYSDKNVLGMVTSGPLTNPSDRGCHYKVHVFKLNATRERFGSDIRLGQQEMGILNNEHNKK